LLAGLKRSGTDKTLWHICGVGVNGGGSGGGALNFERTRSLAQAGGGLQLVVTKSEAKKSRRRDQLVYHRFFE
jgi:hypothetical protein